MNTTTSPMYDSTQSIPKDHRVAPDELLREQYLTPITNATAKGLVRAIYNQINRDFGEPISDRGP